MPISKVLASKAGKASWKKGKAHFTKARRDALRKAWKARKSSAAIDVSKMTNKELMKNADVLSMNKFDAMKELQKRYNIDTYGSMKMLVKIKEATTGSRGVVPKGFGQGTIARGSAPAGKLGGRGVKSKWVDKKGRYK